MILSLGVPGLPYASCEGVSVYDAFCVQDSLSLDWEHFSLSFGAAGVLIVKDKPFVQTEGSRDVTRSHRPSFYPRCRHAAWLWGGKSWHSLSKIRKIRTPAGFFVECLVIQLSVPTRDGKSEHLCGVGVVHDSRRFMESKGAH